MKESDIMKTIYVLHEQSTTLSTEEVGLITINSHVSNGVFKAEVFHRESEQSCVSVFEFGVEEDANEWNHERMVEHVSDLIVCGYFDGCMEHNRGFLIDLGEELAYDII